MFWKKSHNKSDTSKKLFESPEEIRGSFRVTPSSDEPVNLIMDNKSAAVLNISSGGLSCVNIDFKVGSLYSFYFFLPGITRKISGKLEIRQIVEGNRCRCRFHNLDPEFENHIHRYTLNRQKEELEESKKLRRT